MGIHQQIGIAPMPAVARILARFEREQLAGFIAVALDLIDTLDGDPDLELNGDEADGSLGEDDFSPQGCGAEPGPGCPLSDPDYAVDDKPCDEPWQDLEAEQMPGDVPTVPCYAIEPLEDGKRAFLGIGTGAASPAMEAHRNGKFTRRL